VRSSEDGGEVIGGRRGGMNFCHCITSVEVNMVSG